MNRSDIITLLENRGYAVRKGSSLVPTFLGIMLLSFILIRLVPGDVDRWLGGFETVLRKAGKG